MDNKTFKKIVGDVLKSNGFQYSNKQFYCENEELKVFIDFQKSNFGNSFYINIYFLIKVLHKNIGNAKPENIDFHSRFSFIKKGNSFGDFNLDEVDEESITFSINNGLEEKIYPVLDEGIKVYLESKPILKKKCRLEVKKYLGFI